MTWKRIACCDSCWVQRNGQREPIRIVPPDAETCHYCKQETTSGIYTREDVADESGA